jgi:hypothetical protein
MAISHKNLGSNQKAFDIHQKVFEMRKKKLGENNLDTLKS